MDAHDHSDPRRRLGALGERLAREHLERAGYAVVERNFRSRRGEIDVVALGRDTLVFCEVKTRVRGGHAGPADPLEAIGPAKRRRLRLLAREWLSERAGGRPDAGCSALRRDRRDGRRHRPRCSPWSTWRGVLRPAESGGQRELRVRDRLERHPVQRRDAVGGDRRAVLGGRVADVRARSPTRGGARRRGACSGRGVTFASTDAAAMAALRQSPSITARCSCSKGGTLKPSTRQTVPGHATGQQRGAQRLEVGHVKAAGVDPAHAAGDDRRPAPPRASPAGRAPRAPPPCAAWSR